MAFCIQKDVPVVSEEGAEERKRQHTGHTTPGRESPAVFPTACNSGSNFLGPKASSRNRESEK